MFRRADAIMPSDMVFPNLDNQAQATFSEPILQWLLRKRLNYKGVVVGFPLSKAHLRCEEEGAITMLRCGVGCVLAPRDATSVIDAVERSMQTDALFAPISHAVSSLEMFVSKVCSCPESEKIETVFEIARSVFE